MYVNEEISIPKIEIQKHFIKGDFKRKNGCSTQSTHSKNQYVLQSQSNHIKSPGVKNLSKVTENQDPLLLTYKDQLKKLKIKKKLTIGNEHKLIFPKAFPKITKIKNLQQKNISKNNFIKNKNHLNIEAKKKIEEKNKMQKFIKQTHKDVTKELKKNVNFDKNIIDKFKSNKSKLTKLFESCAQKQLKHFSEEAKIKPIFQKNFLPKNLNTEIFKQIYSKYYTEQEDFEQNIISKIKKKSNRDKNKEKDTKILETCLKRNSSSPCSNEIIKNLVKADSTHLFMDQIDYMNSKENNEFKLADKTKFWIIKKEQKQNYFEDETNEKDFQMMNLKEKNNFFHNLKNKGFFSKILKFKNQSLKSLKNFGNEFHKVEKDQSNQIITSQ